MIEVTKIAPLRTSESGALSTCPFLAETFIICRAVYLYLIHYTAFLFMKAMS